MSMLSVIKAKLGQAANTAYNFLFDASAADGTLKLVRENGQSVMLVDSGGRVAFPQGIQNAQVAKAWCQFNGTLTGTNAPVSGFNVTSVTRVSTGIYTITFATPLASANYVVLGSSVVSTTVCVTSQAVSGVTVAVCATASGSPVDVNNAYLTVFGG